MTLAGSLVAFALLFFTATLAFSLGLTLTLLGVRPLLRRSGAWVERQAATAALLLPPLLGLCVVAALAAESTHALSTGADHCLGHGHHLHLCVRHGAAWLRQPGALALVTAVTTFVLMRALASGWSHVMAQRASGRLRSVGAPLRAHCYLVPSEQRFAFTTGLFSPSVLLSTAAWDALEPEEREAVVAHELAHLEQGDLWRRMLLGLAASVGAPGLVDRVMGVWELASERICDRRAAQVVGRPSAVAAALLALVRARPRVAPAGARFAADSHVPERVKSVLSEEPGGEVTAWRLVCALSLGFLAFAVGCANFAEPLHHLFETILG